jgi:hypothetical protein
MEGMQQPTEQGGPQQPPQQPMMGGPQPGPGGQVPQEARTWAMVAHVSSFAGLLIPFGNVLGPLLVWLIKKEEHPFIDEHGKEALNFQIALAVYGLVASILVFIVIGFILLAGLFVFWAVYAILGAIKANNGESIRIPAIFRLVK